MTDHPTKRLLRKPTALVFDGEGFGHEINPETAADQKGLVWIQLSLASAQPFLKKMGNVPEVIQDILCAKETRPRTVAYRDTLVAIFRGVNLNPGEAPEDMVSVRLWMQPGLIITVQNQALMTTTEIEGALKQGSGPTSLTDFLDTFLDTLLSKSAEVVTSLGDQLDLVEDNLSTAPNTINRAELNEMRRRIILMRRYLLPQRDAISRISVDKLSWLNETDLITIRELADANTRVLETLDAERERANVIHEEIFSISQETLNNKMYLLTIVAVIFMPLSFITGLLGINVGGIPGATFKHGFLSVCAILLVVFVLQFTFLKMKRWF